jgi:hypothetical protein
MTSEEQVRLDFLLQNKPLDDKYLFDYYGVKELNNDFMHDFNIFKRLEEHIVNRHNFEEFLKRNRLLPKKFAACDMGMTTNSLEEILGMLNKIGMNRGRYEVYTHFLDEKFCHDLQEHLGNLRFKLRHNHNDDCEMLHEALSELKITVDPLYCATNPVHKYAMVFDCITLKPIANPYILWMEFGKPMNMSADKISKLFFKENVEILKQYIIGNEGTLDQLLEEIGWIDEFGDNF